MPRPLSIINAYELARATQERREPRPEHVLRPDASLEPRHVEEDHSLVDEHDGELVD